MSDTEKKTNACAEHENVTCLLASSYPYCDMTCPMNSYSRQAVIGNHTRSEENKEEHT